MKRGREMTALRETGASSTKRGFGLIELPLVLMLYFLGGLFVAYAFRQFSGPAPWYAWLLCGVIAPGSLFVLGGVTAILDRKRVMRSSGTVEQDEASDG
ncbi:MAG: hypothetical protein AAFU85_26755 [Planctomycetota bacterium]